MIIAMLDSCRPVELASEMKNSICDGADAICVEIGKLEKEFHSGEYYRQIFSYAEDCPVYVTNYRDNFNSGLTDDALAAGLLEALDCRRYCPVSYRCDVILYEIAEHLIQQNHRLYMRHGIIEKQKMLKLDKIVYKRTRVIHIE